MWFAYRKKKRVEKVWDPFGRTLKWTVVIKCKVNDLTIYRDWQRGDFMMKPIKIKTCPFRKKCKNYKKGVECDGIIEGIYVTRPIDPLTEELTEKWK